MKTRYIAAGLAASLALGACNENLTDLNQNPNSPEDVPASTLFTTAARVTGGRWWGTAYSISGPSLLAHHVAKVQYPDEDIFTRLQSGDTQGLFNSPYVEELEDFQRVIAKGEELKAPGTYGPAIVMRSLGFLKLTDTFGDVPYSEALAGDQAGGSIAPKYDAQKDIYADIFVQLAKASTDLAAGGTIGNLGAGDPIFGGNSLRWQRFSNSLRARAAMRLVNVDPAKTDAELRAAMAAPGGLMQSNDDNALLQWPGDGVYDNPVANNFKTRDDHRMSRDLINIMKASADPRLPVYAQPTAVDPSAYVGLENGLASANAFMSTTSRPGAFLYPGATSYGTFGGNGAIAPSLMQTYAEVQFILAEAAARGIAGRTPAQAAGYYQAGIRASFEMWSKINVAAGGPAISSAQIDAYLARPEIVLSSNAVEAQRQIATQKWIHLFTDGGEAWAEWRRTCVPSVIVPGPGAAQAENPRRYMYSPTDIAVNKSNVDAAVTALGGEDTFSARFYWDSKPNAAPTYPGASCGVRH